MAKISKTEARYLELRGQIAYYLAVNGYKKADLAKKLGICPASFYNKLKRPDTFTYNEIICLFDILGLDNSTRLKLIA